MNLDEIIKYLIWVIFFMVVFAGLYLMLKKLGVI